MNLFVINQHMISDMINFRYQTFRDKVKGSSNNRTTPYIPSLEKNFYRC